MSLTAWESLDPTSSFGAPDISEASVAVPAAGYSPVSSSNGLPFFHPDHPMFAFGVVVAVTTGALFLATERRGAGASGSAHVGPVHAGADLGLEGEGK